MKLNLSIFAILYSAALFADAQIGGAVSWNKDTEQNDSSTSAKEILVTGLGQSPEAAEKQALTAAVRQAVGAYLDSNTLLENEAVIRDRILSFSNGFVETYKATAPAKKNSDGLYEVTILATVKSSQVIEALKSNNLISAKIAGQNLWAEAATKVQNAQDSVAFLNEKLPELLKTLIKVEFLDKNGNPTKSIDPAVQIPIAEEVAATWFVRLSVDKTTYFQSFAPVLVKCLQNITGAKGEKFQLKEPQKEFFFNGNPGSACDFFAFSNNDSEAKLPFKIPFLKFPDKILGPDKSVIFNQTMFVVERATSNLDFMSGTMFLSDEYHSALVRNGDSKPELTIELKDAAGELIAKGIKQIRAPFSLRNSISGDRTLPEGQLSQVGPFIYTEAYAYEVRGVNPAFAIQVKIPIDSMKDVKRIECNFDFPSNFQFIIKPAKKN